MAYLQKMKELKKEYRESFDQLKAIKAEVFYIQQSIDALKQQLVSVFEDWYALTFDLEEADSPMVKILYRLIWVYRKQ